MSIKYLYRNTPYDTEAEAQSKLSEMKTRLENNPTDWCVVKYIEDLGDGAFKVLPVRLTDSQILNPDSTKIYTFWSTWTGENFFPLTSTELSEKVLEYRSIYVKAEQLAVIKGFDGEALGLVTPPEDGVTLPETPVELQFTDVTPNEDMSGYL